MRCPCSQIKERGFDVEKRIIALRGVGQSSGINVTLTGQADLIEVGKSSNFVAVISLSVAIEWIIMITGYRGKPNLG